MTPYPPKAGQIATTNVSGTLDETLTGGTWTLSIKLGFLPVYTKTGNSCDLFPGCPCPCAAGAHNGVLIIDVPAIAPQVHSSLRVLFIL